MKAVVNTEYCSPDILRIVEVEKPVPQENEVLIKINATTVETTDTIFCGGKDLFARMATGITKPKDTTPGSEFAGESRRWGRRLQNSR